MLIKKVYPIIEQKTQKPLLLKLKFINKGFDLLNISNIFRDFHVQSKIPQYFEYLEPPLICYQYKKPIKNLIFNYYNLTTDTSVLLNKPKSCSCLKSRFLYQPAGHIITGNLDIIKDRQIKSLFKKGPKFRLPSRIDFNHCKKVFSESLDNYCARWCKKEAVGDYALSDYKKAILDIVDIRIDNFLKNPHLVHEYNSPSKFQIKQKIKKLQENYVLVPADKAANNIIFI